MNESRNETNKYRPVVKYDKKFPRLFDLGDLTATEEDLIYSILGELRDRYDESGIVFGYREIAYMAGLVRYDKRRDVYYAITGKEFDKKIEDLQNKLKLVSYKLVKKVNEEGEVVEYDDIPLFTERFSVSHEKQVLKVFLSTAVIQEEIIDEEGSIVQPKMTVVDLFNNSDWGKTQFLKFGRELHNILRSQYAKRLYRFLSENRTWGVSKISAEVFERNIMKLNTPAQLKKKVAIIDAAVEALKKLTDSHDNPVFGNLSLERIYYKRRLIEYKFTFKHFSLDLNRIIEKSGNKITFDTSNSEVVDNVIGGNSEEEQEVYNKFIEVLGTDERYNNKNNKNNLLHFLKATSKEVVIEALTRTGMDSRRGFGWTYRTLKNWEDAGVKTLDDIEVYQNKKFGNSFVKKDGNDSLKETNIPSWSNVPPNEEQKKLLLERNDFLEEVWEKGYAEEEDYARYDSYAQIIKTWTEKIYVSNTSGLDSYLEFRKKAEKIKQDLINRTFDD